MANLKTKRPHVNWIEFRQGLGPISSPSCGLSMSVTHVNALITMCRSDKKKRGWEKELEITERVANPLCYLNPFV